MEKMNHLKVFMMGLFGGIGSFVISMIGGWTPDLTTLLICMGVDYGMGLLIAAIWKKSGKSKTGALNSVSAWTGLCRKGITLTIVLIAYRLDLTLKVDYIRTAVILAFLVNELISIVENAGIMGIPLPRVLIKAIDVLKEKSNTEGE